MQKPQATGEGQKPHWVLDPSLKQIRHLQQFQSVIWLLLEEGLDRKVEEKAPQGQFVGPKGEDRPGELKRL